MNYGLLNWRWANLKNLVKWSSLLSTGAKKLSLLTSVPQIQSICPFVTVFICVCLSVCMTDSCFWGLNFVTLMNKNSGKMSSLKDRETPQYIFDTPSNFTKIQIWAKKRNREEKKSYFARKVVSAPSYLFAQTPFTSPLPFLTINHLHHQVLTKAFFATFANIANIAVQIPKTEIFCL